MRSRYSAYALGLSAYIIKTTHPNGDRYNSDAAAWKRDIERFSQNTRFVGLQILGAKEDKVTFHAILFEGQHDVSYTEVSLFRQHNGQWKYLSGTLLEH